MKYCDDANCPHFQTEDDSDCALGFNNPLRLPKDMADAVYGNWGYVMPKVCRIRARRIIKLGAMK